VTIFALDGPLAKPARQAGIEVVPTEWAEPLGRDAIRALAEHEVAVIQWEQGPVDLFPRVLRTCERAALAVHGAPQGVTRRLAPPLPMRLRRALERAVAEPRAVVLVRGQAHRRKVAAAYGVAPEALQILPPSVPLASLPFEPAPRETGEVLAMTRLGPEKMSIVRVAVELVRAGLAAGRTVRLAIAGDGPRRAEAIALCERRLPSDSWRLEGAPGEATGRLKAADIVVAQGTTTLEAAALGRRVVVARSLGAKGASATVLTPDRYDEAARDPFGDPPLSDDAARLWDDLLALDTADLAALRRLVESHNSPDAASLAFGAALRS